MLSDTVAYKTHGKCRMQHTDGVQHSWENITQLDHRILDDHSALPLACTQLTHCSSILWPAQHPWNMRRKLVRKAFAPVVCKYQLQIKTTPGNGG